ncbi:MAG: hypothetical protein CVV44_06915 [Spirochaetae bacterium HGW-Spirochaetae-1]|jgi:PAS domain S-box-containing protein|nr:MAG: hypothetical protein CVV44_06915 [Spirochaetae bacterium HGW-Spirochaetae-1]
MLSTLSIVIAGITAYVGLFHISIFFHDRSRKDSIFFSLFCFSNAVYAVFSFFYYGEASQPGAVAWQYGMSLIVPLITISLLWFTLLFIGQKSRRVSWLITAFYGAYYPVAIILDPSCVRDAGRMSVRIFDFPGGIDVRYYDAAPGILTYLLYAVHIFLFIYLIILTIRSLGDGRKEAKPLAAVLAVLILSFAYDVLVGRGVFDGVYFMGYTCFMAVLIINRSLSMKIVGGASALHSMEESEERYRAIFENRGTATGIVDRESTVLLCNERFEELSGYSKAEIEGKMKWTDFIYQEDAERLRSNKTFLQDGNVFQFECRLNSRSEGEKYIQVNSSYIQGKGLYVVSLNDITDRRTAQLMLLQKNLDLKAANEELEVTNEEFEAQNEELAAAYTELESREKQYRDIFNMATDSLFIYDEKGLIALANPTACETYGYTAEELKDMEISRLVHTDYRHLFSEFMDSMRKNETYRGNAMDIRKDGTTLYTEVRGYWITYMGKPHILSVVRDITERKRAEDLVVQSEKMMTVGGLAAGMAHEINNPLSVIIQGIQAALNRISPGSEKNREVAAGVGIDLNKLEQYLEERHINVYFRGMQEAAARAAKIVSSMLNFSRSGSTRISTSLHGIINESIGMAEKDYSFEKKYDFKHISIKKDLDESIGDILCVPEEIEQVFLNILKNAAAAMSENQAEEYTPEIIITTRREQGHVVITIGDNGPGMDEKVKKRVFEPFFTTKSPGSGTGLGLSVSYFIITSNHHGTIEVESESGRGTIFTVKLPLGAE